MCVIYACHSALPPMDELHRGAFRNDDGAGIAWLGKKGKSVRFVKGLKDENDTTAYIKENDIPFPLVIHFRTASVGGKCDELCHPFPLLSGIPPSIEGEAPSVLFHNGHVSDWQELVVRAGLAAPPGEKFPEGIWSDSRGLAWLTYLRGPGILPFIIEKSRVCLFSTPTGNEHPFSLFGSWVSEKGWSQSIATDWVQTTPIHRGTWISCEGGTSTKDLASDKTDKTLSNHNIWTVAELLEVLTDIEKEQAIADTALGS